MAEQTIYVYATADVSITHADGSPTRNSDLLNSAQHGNSFSWENPNDLAFTFSGSPVAVTFEDPDGIIEDNPYSGNTVTDQLLTQPVTIGARPLRLRRPMSAGRARPLSRTSFRSRF